MEHTRYATEDDFAGRLSYALSETEDERPIPELWDLRAILHSVSTLRTTFERLEHAGVCIPAVCGLTDGGQAEPGQNWQELLKRISQSVYHLDAIVIEMLSQERRPTMMDSVCCGMTQ
jgi:hypothetical protein